MSDAKSHVPEANGVEPTVVANTPDVPPSNEVGTQMNGNRSISADEIALYDRQIRLWGVQAQEKLRNAKILLITVRALSNEIAKNLVLAGIGSLTVQDDQTVKDEDLGAQFFVSEEDVGKNRAEAAAPHVRKLNPRVIVNVETQDIRTKDVDFYVPYDMVIATDLDLKTLSTINAASRLSGKPFYAAATHGLYGFIFADLNQHHFVIEREKSNRPTVAGRETPTRNIVSTSTKRQDGKVIEMVTKQEIYTPIPLANTSPLPEDLRNSRRRKLQVPPLLSCLRAIWEFENISGRLPGPSIPDLELFTTLAHQKHQELQLPPETLRPEILRSFMQNLGNELAPVTAFLGGQLAQDVINVLGQREQPIQNFLLFDGEESKGPVYALHPIFPDMDVSLPTPMPAALSTAATMV
ncbi:uncharacterized protein KY384_003745 [Bacidia gigantensis]|uniref:uncharacterized protein n=1 Tax=Bacidia gigantensis TaxID=2732470 RepID=UPI001D03A742|nr:uncharacterized protein KY384_003745 [Bacidia gigantensis]KAG8532108.1 hypothetical protein KY384_003745 [Bacidia gigantensis]